MAWKPSQNRQDLTDLQTLPQYWGRVHAVLQIYHHFKIIRLPLDLLLNPL